MGSEPNEAAAGQSVVRVGGLSVDLPGGQPLVEDADVELGPGRVLVLLGPSGSGKTTLTRAMFRPEELTRRGYQVRWRERAVAPPAIVPQRGALFDHLDVAGNIELAQAAGGQRRDAAPWLKEVDLGELGSARGRPVSALSGGQAQRVAVARTLAAGRTLLLLDEPSAGLDPLGVRSLARLLLRTARERSAAILVITHDVQLAAGVADQVLFLSPAARSLLSLPTAGPAELCLPDERRRRVALLEAEVERALEAEGARPAEAALARRAVAGGAAQRGAGALAVAGASLARLFDPRMVRESSVVFARSLGQALGRPLLFYTVVGFLLGITVPYVVVHISAGLRPGAVLRLIGGSYILSLAPPLSAIVFTATSGSALAAWLGGLRLGGQIDALEGLGVSTARYLWSPTWLALLLSYVATAVLFAASMVGGGYLLFRLYEVPGALSVLTADFLDPAPSRVPFLVRGLWSVGAYAVCIASVVVSRGEAPKESSADVTRAMTSAVVRLTLLVVALELASVSLLFAQTRGAP